ncbi:MAG: hypothetical protein KA250_07420 [Verrucomicrobiales bacterium]|jgi:hypothetical protein|nr:hypothetical protein [Verrucomicrobiales bacterium]MBP9225660.1 hypothetical protein [Verrucomicrobiales bacterium]
MNGTTENRKLETLRDRACSKILWGDREEEVYRFLRAEGVASELADQFIAQAQSERAAMIRKRCTVKFIAGLIGAIVCGAGLAFFEFKTNVTFTGRGYFQLIASLWTGFAACGIFTLKNGWAVLTGKTMGAAMDD